MISVEKHIKELIYLHDCVIIPGFGAFVSRNESAGIHPVSHTFTPPHKSVSFNEQLQQEDDVLATHIAEQHGISMVEAREKIDIFVRKLVLKLNTNDHVMLNDLGSFSIKDQQLSFRFSNNENLLGNSFGFNSFQSPAISRESFEANIKSQLQDSQQIKKSVSRINWKVAAVALPLAALSLIAGLKGDRLDDVYANYAHLNPFADREASYSPRENFGTAAFEMPEFNTNTTTLSSTKDKSSKPEKAIVKTFKSYYLIAGCFSSEKNAEGFAQELRQNAYQADVVGQSEKGLYRVSIGQYPNRSEAFQQISYFKEKGFNVWILKQ